MIDLLLSWFLNRLVLRRLEALDGPPASSASETFRGLIEEPEELVVVYLIDHSLASALFRSLVLDHLTNIPWLVEVPT